MNFASRQLFHVLQPARLHVTWLVYGLMYIVMFSYLYGHLWQLMFAVVVSHSFLHTPLAPDTLAVTCKNHARAAAAGMRRICSV